MAALTSPITDPSLAFNKVQAADERRREPRFGAEGEVTVVVWEKGQQREIIAKLMDFSLHGLRIQSPAAISDTAEVHVFFSWGEVTTNVMWTKVVPSGFEIGLQLF